MSNGSTPAPTPAPFAVGYGNGYGYESAADAASAPVGSELLDRADPMATVAVTVIDLGLDRTVAMDPIPVPTVAPFTARPVGAAHPRRRLGRGLVVGGLSLLALGAGIGAVATVSGADVGPASASSAASPRTEAAAAASAAAIGGDLGRGVNPSAGGPGASTTIPTSVLASPTITRVPPPLTAPPATAPPTTAPPTTAPPATTPPTTTPSGPIFTSVTAPVSVDCPTPESNASVDFSWSATGATQVTLSIDGPGIYRTYAGSSGSESVNFPCGQSHTYLFTAYGAGGATTTRTITIAPS